MREKLQELNRLAGVVATKVDSVKKYNAIKAYYHQAKEELLADSYGSLYQQVNELYTNMLDFNVSTTIGQAFAERNIRMLEILFQVHHEQIQVYLERQLEQAGAGAAPGDAAAASAGAAVAEQQPAVVVPPDYLAQSATAYDAALASQIGDDQAQAQVKRAKELEGYIIKMVAYFPQVVRQLVGTDQTVKENLKQLESLYVDYQAKVREIQNAERGLRTASEHLNQQERELAAKKEALIKAELKDRGGKIKGKVVTFEYLSEDEKEKLFAARMRAPNLDDVKAYLAQSDTEAELITENTSQGLISALKTELQNIEGIITQQARQIGDFLVDVHQGERQLQQQQDQQQQQLQQQQQQQLQQQQQQQQLQQQQQQQQLQQQQQQQLQQQQQDQQQEEPSSEITNPKLISIALAVILGLAGVAALAIVGALKGNEISQMLR